MVGHAGALLQRSAAIETLTHQTHDCASRAAITTPAADDGALCTVSESGCHDALRMLCSFNTRMLLVMPFIVLDSLE